MGQVGIVNILLMHDAASTAVNGGILPLMMACKHAYSLSTVALIGGGPHQQRIIIKSAQYAFEAYKESYIMKQ